MPKYVYSEVKCPFCEEVRKSTGLHKHIKTHGSDKWQEYLSSKETTKIYNLVSSDLYQCVVCEFKSSTRQSVTSHWWRNHTEKGQKHVVYGSEANKAKRNAPAWNKGLTKETDKRVAQYGTTISKNTKGKKGRPHTQETKQKISKIASVNNKGGKCKWYQVAGQKVQGTWEKNVALKLEEFGIKWEKIKTNNHTFEYLMNNKIRSYSPDFYLVDLDIYLEIKGRWWGNDREKMDIVTSTYPDKKILVIEKEMYQRILDGEQVWLL